MAVDNEVRNIDLFGNLLSLKQDIFDAVHPIGETYTQYPQQDPPATVYNKNGITSEWETINDYDGAFFRAEGTNANPFTEKGTALNVQNDMVRSHNHYNAHVHYIDHKHWTEGTSGGCSDRGTDTTGWHEHGLVLRCGDGTGNYGVNNVMVDDGDLVDSKGLIGGNYASGAGSHSHTINDHTHWWGNWSGWCHYDYGNNYFTGRPYCDGPVVWDGTQYVDRSWTDSNDNNAIENRPKNYTIKIWKRTN